jgi:hypothetical protein
MSKQNSGNLKKYPPMDGGVIRHVRDPRRLLLQQKSGVYNGIERLQRLEIIVLFFFTPPTTAHPPIPSRAPATRPAERIQNQRAHKWHGV